jgi:cell division initiation protein
LEEARRKALEEKKKLESTIEEEKEKLVDIKKEVMALRSEVIGRLKKFDAQIGEVVGPDEADK